MPDEIGLTLEGNRNGTDCWVNEIKFVALKCCLVYSNISLRGIRSLCAPTQRCSHECNNGGDKQDYT